MKEDIFPGLPENYHLTKLDWQIIGHLTFAESRPAWKRESMFFAVMRMLAKRERTYFTKLLWVLKQEWGKGDDIPHYHFLIAALPPEARCLKNCRRIKDDWVKVGGGLSQIELFDPKLSGRDYILKRTGEKSGIARSLLGNLEDTSGLTLSESVQEYLNRRS
jgi:hypothetical protein